MKNKKETGWMTICLSYIWNDVAGNITAHAVLIFKQSKFIITNKIYLNSTWIAFELIRRLFKKRNVNIVKLWIYPYHLMLFANKEFEY